MERSLEQAMTLELLKAVEEKLAQNNSATRATRRHRQKIRR